MKQKNIIRIFKDGPLHLTGKLVLKDGEEKIIEKSKELYLCRCGQSKNKPYCDGAHKHTFQEPGKFINPPVSEGGLNNVGKVVIRAQTNGPLLFKGNVCIQDKSENKLMRKIGSLCRCGHSANYPFCDGTHGKIEFTAD